MLAGLIVERRACVVTHLCLFCVCKESEIRIEHTTSSGNFVRAWGVFEQYSGTVLRYELVAYEL